MTRVFISCDSSARSVGADEVADAIRSFALRDGHDVEVVRTGSRGMFWLEPYVEVETARGRIGYGNVTVDDIRHMMNIGMLDGRPLANSIGIADEYPWLAQQHRVTFARMGIVDPT